VSLSPPDSGEREQEIADAVAPALAALTPDGGGRHERQDGRRLPAGVG
jgi:hypothetical protein